MGRVQLVSLAGVLVLLLMGALPAFAEDDPIPAPPPPSGTDETASLSEEGVSVEEHNGTGCGARSEYPHKSSHYQGTRVNAAVWTRCVKPYPTIYVIGDLYRKNSDGDWIQIDHEYSFYNLYKDGKYWARVFVNRDCSNILRKYHSSGYHFVQFSPRDSGQAWTQSPNIELDC